MTHRDSRPAKRPLLRIPPALGAAVSTLLLALGSAHAQPAASVSQASEQGEGPKEGKAKAQPSGRSQWLLRPSALARYRSNLLHEQRRRLDQFSTDTAAGQRFYQLKGPWDIQVRPELEGGWHSKVGKKRDLELGLGASYTFHARNPIADFFSATAHASYEISARDRLGLQLAVTPDRFDENFRADGVGGNAPFTAASYAQVSPTAFYRHRWNKRWQSRLAYRYKMRRYETPHTNHDLNSHSVLLSAQHEPTRRFSIGARLHADRTDTPNRVEGGGFAVDRSYWQGLVGAELQINLPRRMEASAGVDYRLRKYSTSEPLDQVHHDRTDQRPAVRLALHKDWGDASQLGVLGVGIAGSYLLNITNRQHPTYSEHQLGYDEWTVGVIASFTL